MVQLSAAVNRAWGSSMEIGVRVMREAINAPLGHQTYCCHAYLTFVAKHVPPPPPTLFTSLARSLNLAFPPKPVRFQVPELQPNSTLETKRFLLAGRRRAHRIQRSKKSEQLLAAFRSQLMQYEEELQEGSTPDNAGDTIAQIQLEMLVEGWMKNDPDVKVEGDFVVAEIEGFMEPVRVPLAEVKKAAATRGHGGYRKLSVPSADDVEQATGRRMSLNGDTRRHLADMEAPLDQKDTLVMGLWIIRPQHGEYSWSFFALGSAELLRLTANSKNVLFGGELMRRVEEMSAVA